MNRIINADKIIRFLDEIYKNEHYLFEHNEGGEKEEYRSRLYLLNHIMDSMGRMIENDSSDVEEVRHGRWMTQEYMYDRVNGDYWQERPAEDYDEAYCSLCGKNAGLNGAENYERTPFCPHCGAKMDLT